MELSERHLHRQIKLSITGAAETGHCGPNALDQALELGREIAKSGAVLVSGATTGFPLWTARGAKEAGGMSIGLSPATDEREHVDTYKLPLEYMDLIIYTGAGYSGRDLLMTRSSDAVFVGCGRIGTIHEFTIAFEDNKPIGVLQGEWKTDEVIKDILDNSDRAKDNQKIVFDSDPKRLVAKVLELVKKDKDKDYRS
jgi:uncharacterized protein (TIGR00725 family)